MKFNLSKGGPLGKYFFQKEKIVYGPFIKEDVINKIGPETMVYTESGEWKKAREYSEFGFKAVVDKNKESKKIVSTDENPSLKTDFQKPSSGNKWALPFFIFVILIGGAAYYFINNFNQRSSETEQTIAADTTAAAPAAIANDATNDLLTKNYIEDYQLNNLSYSDIDKYRDELLARHGYIFEDYNKKAYFSQQSWYSPQNDFLTAASQFNAIEKSNFQMLDQKLTERKNAIVSHIQSYFSSIVNNNFDASQYFSQNVNQYITRKNLTPFEINDLYTKESVDFQNPQIDFLEPFVFSCEKGQDGQDYFLFSIYYQVFRPSKNKYQSCIVNLKVGIDRNMRIFHYEEVDLKNLKFSESPIAQSTSTTNWMVIIGSYTNESEAQQALNSVNEYGFEAEIINTDRYTNLTPGLYVVCSGKNLSQIDASSILNNIKNTGLNGYIKDAGPEKIY
jgi:hypothetical protein